MSSRKPSIPDTTGVEDSAAQTVLDALAENVEILTGRRGVKVVKLGGAATTGAIITKINELIDLLQA